jgi:predicted CDP-diglyceride synthetase/phosphatidate cytidylyltransferase
MIEGHGGKLDRLDGAILAASLCVHRRRWWWTPL